jgi:hypothetical protein
MQVQGKCHKRVGAPPHAAAAAAAAEINLASPTLLTAASPPTTKTGRRVAADAKSSAHNSSFRLPQNKNAITNRNESVHIWFCR